MNRLKRLLLCGLLCGWVLSEAMVQAEENLTETCKFWNMLGEQDRNMYLLGWLDAMHSADKITSDEILSKLWPDGHRVGSVEIEMNVECRKPDNIKMTIAESLMRIVKRLNGQ